MDYAESKRLAADRNTKVRIELAGRSDVKPEVLYFLAEDESADVRKRIAGNEATPRHADLLLARDRDQHVREHLAQKIGKLAPSLSQDERAQIRDMTIQVIETLAKDQAVRIREIVAEALKDLTNAPPHVIQQLARDLEIRVSAPVLEFSPLLSDSDLLELISNPPIRGALTVIAKRRGLAPALADALIAATVEAPAEAATIAALLKNGSAQIREEALDRILDHAPMVEDWHEPLTLRPKLPMGAVRRLAEFVSKSLLEILKARPDLDPATAKAVAKTVKKRLADEKKPPEAKEAGAPVGEEAINAAIAGGKADQIVAALARDAALSVPVVQKIMGSMSAKAITALAWKAKLTMRQALQLQLRIGGIPPQQVLNPRGGTDYPLAPAEMDWQLELFTGS